MQAQQEQKFLRITNGRKEQYWCIHCLMFKPKTTYYNHRNLYNLGSTKFTPQDIELARNAIPNDFIFGMQYFKLLNK